MTALEDLTPLGQALQTCQILLHGGERDLQLLSLHTALAPQEVVDTQILAGCAGLGYPRRLEDLLVEVLGHTASQAPPGLSDWSRRPLQPEQIAYAAADVASLHRLAQALEALVGPDRALIAEGATGERVDHWLTPADPRQAWRRIPAATVMSVRERQRLRHLATWREEEARRHNLGTWNIASDRVLVDLARRAPRSLQQLRSNRLMPKGLVKRHGEALLALLASAPEVSLRPLASTPRARAFQAALQAWSHAQEVRTGVAAALVMPSWRLDGLVAGWLEQGAVEDLAPWLEVHAGDELRDLSAGRFSLRFDPTPDTPPAGNGST